MKFKRIIGWLLVGTIAISGVGCAKNNAGPTPAPAQNEASTQTTDTQTTETNTEESTSAEQASTNGLSKAFQPQAELTPMTLFKTISGDEDPNYPGETGVDNKYIPAMKERLNIDYQFTNVMKSGSAAEEKVKLMVTSNDIPDVLTVSYDLFRYMTKANMLEDISAVYDEYGYEFMKYLLQTDGGKALEMASVDGKLYGIPSMGTMHNADQMIWLRKDWLDKLNMELPTDVESLCAVLEAFKTKDPDGNGQDDTVGLAVQETFAEMQMFGLQAIFQAYKSYIGTWQKGADGTVQYAAVMPETKEALIKIRDMYQKGLLQQDFAITKNDSAAELVISGKSGAFFGPWWSGWTPVTDQIKNDASADWVPVFIKDIDGNANAIQEKPIGDVAVLKKGYKAPEAFIKTMNFYVAVQGGGNPEDAGGDPYNGKVPVPSWTWFPIILGLWDADAVYFDNECMVALSKNEEIPDTVTASQKAFYQSVADQWNKGMDWLKANPDELGEPFSRFVGVAPLKASNVQPVYSEFYGSTDTLTKRKATLDKLEKQAMLDIILGNQPIEYFDEFVKQWMAMGGDIITKEVNAAVNNK